MKTVLQDVFLVSYKEDEFEYSMLVEANDFIEALDIFNSYYTKKCKVISISRYQPIIKPLTKTVTIEL